MSSEPIILVICGGGNGAHAWAGIASSEPNVEVRVLTLFQDEAERWSDSLQKNDFTVNLFEDGALDRQLKTKPKLVTKQPEKAILGCDIIAFILPAFAHEQYLEAIKPYVEPGMILVGFPGQAGFEFQVRSILGADLAKQITLINGESIPWATRTTEFGKSCDVLGTKVNMMAAIKKGLVSSKKDPSDAFQHTVGMKTVLTIKGHLLAPTLMSVNAYLHTSISYAQWATWDGKPLDEKPLFYNGLSEEAAGLLSSMSNEVLAIAEAITTAFPEADMSQVVHMHDYYIARYANEIHDQSSLYTTIRTNRAFSGLTHPMVATKDGKWMPDFNYRYYTEDLPFGLVVIRGIAEIMGVATPNIDKVLTWAQARINKKYLVDGKIQGEDVKATRAPQRYGFTTIDDLMGH